MYEEFCPKDVIVQPVFYIIKRNLPSSVHKISLAKNYFLNGRLLNYYKSCLKQQNKIRLRWSCLISNQARSG